MRDVLFKPRIGAIEGAYSDFSARFVMLRSASLPDVCIVCGTPARGNLYRAAFEPYHFPSWHVPIFYDIAYWIVGRRYIVDFPFCSICRPENFDIHAVQIDEKAGFFSGVSTAFLKLLPRIPQELAVELEGTWARRVCRSILSA